MSIEHWDELPVDELRTRIAELEQYARDCRRFTKAVEYTFAAFPPERRAAHLGLRAAELAKRGDALLPKVHEDLVRTSEGAYRGSSTTANVDLTRKAEEV